MRHRSKTNSRPWENVKVRRAYMAKHGDRCHLTAHFPHDCGGRLDPHHLFHVGNVKWDLEGNLLSICRSTHDYIHDVDSTGGTIACMYAKLFRKRRASRDRIRKHWQTALGRDAVIGWLEVRLDQGRVPAEFLATAHSILEMF